uniref:Uncharacterized protein n=1 Tax=Oryza glumipatula TaxID=40148 RepID=A0A0E0AST0_9ORYZ
MGPASFSPSSLPLLAGGTGEVRHMASLTVADRGRWRQGKEMRTSAMDEREAASTEEGERRVGEPGMLVRRHRRHADGSRRSPPSPTRSAEAEGPPSSGVHGKKPAGGAVVGKAVGGEADVDEVRGESAGSKRR